MNILKSISILFVFFVLGLVIVLTSNYYLTFQAGARPAGVWDFAARVMPDALSQQVGRESVASDWIGDPRRFTAIEYGKGDSAFYLVWTNVDCPEKGGCDPFYRRPTCGAAGACQFVGYARRGDRYVRVFTAYILQQLPFEKGFSSISERWADGVPECFALVGIDVDNRPETLPDGTGRVAYCYSQVERQFKYRGTSAAS